MSGYIKGITAVVLFTGMTVFLTFQSLVNLMNPADRQIQNLRKQLQDAMEENSN